MSIATKLRRAPGRIAAGTFILNSGLNKLKIDDEGAAQLHGMAVGAYPFLDKVKPKTFTRGLGATEIAIGGALLLPVAPPVLVGAGLTAFSGALLGLYWRTPELHSPGDPRPTEHGLPFAKDSWLAGIALGLLVDALTPDLHTKRVVKRSTRRADKAEAHAAETDARLDEAVERATEKATEKALRKRRREQLAQLAEERMATTKKQAKAARKAARKRAKKMLADASGTAQDWTSTAQQSVADVVSGTADTVRRSAHALTS